MPRLSGTDTTPPPEEDFIYASQEDSGELGLQEEISEDSGYRLVPNSEKINNLTSEKYAHAIDYFCSLFGVFYDLKTHSLPGEQVDCF